MSNSRNRWIAFALVISLAINIALAGYMVGVSNKPPPSFDPTRGFALWTRSLPEERRRELRGLLRAHSTGGRHQLRGLMRHNTQMQEALLAVPFEAERLNQVLTTLRARGSEMQTHSHHAFVQMVSQLTNAERALLAEDLSKPRRHRPGFMKNRLKPASRPLDPD